MEKSPMQVDGYQYHLNRVHKDFKYYLCSNRSRYCFARGVLNPDGSFNLSIAHNHPQDHNLQLISCFRRELYRAVTNSTSTNREIYETLRLLYPEAASLLPFAAIESSMYRWKSSCRPPCPSTIQDYYNLLASEQWCSLLRYDRGSLHTDYLNPSHDIEIMVFYDNLFVGQLLEDGEINIDSTFRCVPRIKQLPRCTQLLTIMVTKYNHAFPVIWAVMTKRTLLAYRTLFSHLLNVFPNMKISSIMCDFEKALYRVLVEIFPNAKIHGCFFHFCQAIYRHARKLGLEPLVVNNETALNILKKLMALALVPSAKIPEAFNIIKEETPDCLQPEFHEMFVYIEVTWLRGVTADIFSVYKLLRRTNNCIEAYHRILNQKLGIHPNVWVFTEKLVKLQSRVHNDFLTAKSGRRVTRTPKIRYLVNSSNILWAWVELECAQKGLLEFLENAKYFVSTLTDGFQGDNTIIDDYCDDFEFINGESVPLQNMPEMEDDHSLARSIIRRTALARNTLIASDVEDTQNLNTEEEGILIRGGRRSRSRPPRHRDSERGRSARQRHRSQTLNHDEIQIHRRTSSRRGRRRSRGLARIDLVGDNQMHQSVSISDISNSVHLSEAEPPIANETPIQSEVEIMAYVDQLFPDNDTIFEPNTVDSDAITLELDRSNIVSEMFIFYEIPEVTLQPLNVVFKNENGSDFGGLTKEAFTVFWDCILPDYFRGENILVPFLPLHRVRKDKANYKLIGRALTHMLLLTKTLPAKLSKCVFAPICEANIDIPDDVIMEDFMLFVTQVESSLIAKAILSFSLLTSEELSTLQLFYGSYGLYDVPREGQVGEQVLALACDVLVSRPREFVTAMRTGILNLHLTTLWGTLSLPDITNLLNKQRPTSEAIVKCLTVTEDDLSNAQSKVFYYLQQFVASLNKDDLLKFLLFVTGSVHLPEIIKVTFNNLNGLNCRPIAHTCSNLIELSLAYYTYQDFKREMQLYLSDEYSYQYSQL